VSVFLLDVNVLVAMAWPTHIAHEQVGRWLRRARIEWATCPFTQAGFVRILSNPSFSADALTPTDAAVVLSKSLTSPAHRFWAIDIGLSEANQPFREQIVGHQQVTDAYLLGLTIHKKGKLATLDRGILDLLPPDSPYRASVELIGK